MVLGEDRYDDAKIKAHPVFPELAMEFVRNPNSQKLRNMRQAILADTLVIAAEPVVAEPVAAEPIDVEPVAEKSKKKA